MRYILILLLVGLLQNSTILAQSVRKPWTELTSSERTLYVNTINALNNGTVTFLADEHDDLFFDGIHTVSEFLPWHRFFIKYFEDQLQNINSDVTIPYWDWHQSWDDGSLLFKNGSGVNSGLLGKDVSSSVWGYSGTLFSRNFDATVTQPSSSYSSIQNFSSFSENLRTGAHAAGHSFVGGDMTEDYSPIDPMFYIHHAMVDKAWWDWREKYPNESVSVLTTSLRTFAGYSPSTINGQALVDSKSLGVWYAYNHLLEIENFDFVQDQDFKYSTGSINVEDVTLSSSTDMEIYIKSGSAYKVKIIESFDAPTGSTLKIGTY